LVGLRRLPHANQDTNNSIESYHGALKIWLSEFTRGASGRRLDWLVWRLTTFIVSHYIYIEEQKFKGFIPNKKVEAIVGKGIEKACNILINDVLQPTSLDNRWKVKSQNPTIFTQWYYFRGNPFVEYACCSCERALKGNFCKHQIAILLKFLPDCRESSILEYCGTYYGTQRGGLKALCLFSKPHEISDFEEELDEDTCGHTCREEEENSDIDDEQIEDTMVGPTQEVIALRMKQLLEGI
jgi:hypothetical protein